MASRTKSSGFDGFLRWLAAYRLVVYFGGLVAIATPRLLRTLGNVTLGPTARTAIVVASMAVMILTYIGERRRDATNHRGSDPATDRARPESTATDARRGGSGADPATEASAPADERPQYSRRTRAVFATGILGVVFGIYVALEASLPAGLLFVFGAILFVQSAYRRERGGETE